ncbi:MAG: TAXI family TRAP transporter solute-binding subunit, partial [Alphaproteobacteria bacterium]
IPADAYPGVAPVETLTVGAQWVVSADVDEALVYAITRALWHDSTRRLLLRGHAEGGKIRLATALDGIGIPLHPGAERYYREIGRLK